MLHVDVVLKYLECHERGSSIISKCFAIDEREPMPIIIVNQKIII
jgi:hypothetical protein